MFLCLTSVISTIYKYTLSLLVPKQMEVDHVLKPEEATDIHTR